MISPFLLALAIVLAHLWADFIVQTDPQSADKPACWRAMTRHVASYHAVMAPVALAGWGWSWRALVFVTVSVVTHAWLDRRWPVVRLMQLTGSPDFAAWPAGRLIVDQVCHLTVLLVTYAALTPEVW